MSGALTTNLLLCYLNTTTIADDTLITDTLILTAGTLIVLRRTEDALTEQTVTLRLIGTVVDGFRFGNLTEATPKLLSRISSGEASPMVIFVKLLFTFESFLKAIFRFYLFSIIPYIY